MIANKYGFSFVEIIVVVSILAIMSGVSISSMNTNFDKQALYGEVSMLQNTIANLDESLGRDITDYELYLLTGSRYYYYTNKNYKSLHQSLTLSGNNWSIKTNDTMKNNLDLMLYFNDKKTNTYSFSSTESFSGSFSQIGKYQIKTLTSEYNLNNIYINSYTNFDTKKDIALTQIEDGIGNTFTGIKITNTVGKVRVYYNFAGNRIITPIILHFDYKGIPIELKLDEKS